MKGKLKSSFIKNGKKTLRKLNKDRNYISRKGSKYKLHGRSLLLNRNRSSYDHPKYPIERWLRMSRRYFGCFITSASCLHDFKIRGNSRKKSIYIVKPKMHGPEECNFTNIIFENVEKSF